jgi:hypothetical protein
VVEVNESPPPLDAPNVAEILIGVEADDTVKLQVVAVGFAQLAPVHVVNEAPTAGVSASVTGVPSA